MKRDWEAVQKLLDRYNEDHKESIEQKFRLLDAMHSFAVSLGHFKNKDFNEGIETDLNVAHILNSHVSRDPLESGEESR